MVVIGLKKNQHYYLWVYTNFLSEGHRGGDYGCRRQLLSGMSSSFDRSPSLGQRRTWRSWRMANPLTNNLVKCSWMGVVVCGDGG